MPRFTPKFQVPYFYYGDQYSAHFDKLRFTSIDNYLNGLGNVFGDGVIRGFEVTEKDSNTISISSGSAFINKEFKELRIDTEISYSKENGAKIKIRSKAEPQFNNNFIQDIKSVSFYDSIFPSPPIDIKIEEIDYYKVKLSWSVKDLDISSINVYKDSFDDGVENFTRAYLLQTVKENSIVDSNVTPGSKYIYYFDSIDINGNRSLSYEKFVLIIPDDLVAPDPPKFFSAIIGNRRVQAIWSRPSFKNVSFYEIEIFEIDSSYSAIGDILYFEIGYNINNFIINELKSNSRYKISLRAVSSSGKKSIYLDKFFITKQLDIEDEIKFISHTAYEFDNRLIFDVDWMYSLDPYNDSAYDPSVQYKYRVYELDLQNTIIKTGDFVLLLSGQDTVALSGLVFSDIATGTTILEPFQENKRYLFGIFKIKNNSLVSPGVYSYLNPINFLPPDPPNSVNTTFQNDRSLLVQVDSDLDNSDDFFEISLFGSKILNSILDFSNIRLNESIIFKSKPKDILLSLILSSEDDLQSLFMFTLTSDYLLIEFDFQRFNELFMSAFSPSVSVGNSGINWFSNSYWPADGIRVNFIGTTEVINFHSSLVRKLGPLPVAKVPAVPGQELSGDRILLFSDLFEINFKDYYPYVYVCSDLLNFSRVKPSSNPNNQSFFNGDAESTTNLTDESTFVFINQINENDRSNIITKYSLGDTEFIAKKIVSKTSTVVFDSSVVRPGYAYRADVVTVDKDNQRSDKVSSLIYSPTFETITPPPRPDSQIAYFMSNRVMITWVYPKYDADISRFNIYRANFDYSKKSSYVRIASVNSRVLFYQDFNIVSGKSYIYVILSVDAWGKESILLSRSSDSYSTGIVTVPTYKVEYELSVTPIINGQDLSISWLNSSSLIDGIEILCQKPNSSEFKAIHNSNLDSGELTIPGFFTDNGFYVFGISGSFNQVEIFIDYSEDTDGLEIARIKSSFNSLYISDSRRILLGLQDPVIEETDNSIVQHNHLLTDEVDKRIDLSELYRVNDWTVLDEANTKFISTSEFPKNYTRLDVYLDNVKNTVLYDFDYNSKTIHFSKMLWPRTEGDVAVVDVDGNPVVADMVFNPTLHMFIGPVTIDLVFMGFSETDGQLSYDKFGQLFAEQFNKGIIKKNQFEQMEHSGRVNERLIPYSCTCSSDDGYKFIISRNENNKLKFFDGNNYYLVDDFGDEINDLPENSNNIGFDVESCPIVCYDILPVPGYPNKLYIYATSQGLYYSFSSSQFYLDKFYSNLPPNDFGPPTKLKSFNMNGRNFFVSIFPRGIMIFEIISVDPSLPPVIKSIFNEYINGVSFIHDISFNQDTLYISSNLGLFTVKVVPPTIIPVYSLLPMYIIQMPIVSLKSNEVFSAFFLGGVLFSCMSSGIYKYDAVSNFWEIAVLLPEQDIIESIIVTGDMYLLFGTHNIYRISEYDLQSGGDAINNSYGVNLVYKFDKEYIQSACIYQGRIVISTDVHCYISNTSISITNSKTYSFKHFAYQLKFNGMHTSIYSIVSDSQENLYFCQEGRVFRARSLSRINIFIDFHSNMTGRDKFNVPSYLLDDHTYDNKIYLENNESSSAGSQSVIYSKFRIDTGMSFKCIRNYSNYHANGGGWASHDFASPVYIKVNGRRINDGSRARKPYDQIISMMDLNLFNFDDKISNFSLLAQNYDILQSHISYMTTNTTNAFGDITELGIHRFTRNNVRKLIFFINKVNSSIYSPEITREMGIFNSIYLDYPDFIVDLVANVYADIDGYTGVNINKLNEMDIKFDSYQVTERPGSLCTYDLEDNSYYLPPNIPLGEICSSSLQPNYNLSLSESSFGLSDDISGLNSFFTNIISGGAQLSAIYRNRRVGPIADGGQTFGGGITRRPDSGSGSGNDGDGALG